MKNQICPEKEHTSGSWHRCCRMLRIYAQQLLLWQEGRIISTNNPASRASNADNKLKRQFHRENIKKMLYYDVVREDIVCFRHF